MKVEKKIELKSGVQDVWNALTDPELTKQYFFKCETISDWNEGSSIIFRSSVDGVETVHVEGVILKIRPQEYLEYSCYPPGGADDASKHTVVTIELTPNGDSTELAITQGPFTDKAALEHTDASWNSALNGLKVLVER